MVLKYNNQRVNIGPNATCKHFKALTQIEQLGQTSGPLELCHIDPDNLIRARRNAKLVCLIQFDY